MASVGKVPLRVALRRPRFGAGGRSQTPAAILFLLPGLLILTVFHFFPLLYSFYISLHRWRFVNEAYVGLHNYDLALHSDEVWTSLVNSIYFTVAVVPTTMVISLVLSVMLFQRVRLLSVYRTVYFLPYITSSVAAAGIWAWIFNPQYGIANRILGTIGIGHQRWLQESKGFFAIVAGHYGVNLPGWAQGPSLALVAISIFTIWSYVGFEIVIFLVGLGNIPGEIYEAAKVDGATAWQVLRKISLPLLSPSIVLVSIITTIGSFQEFNRIYQMSSEAALGGRPGGPLGTTQTLVVLIYNQFSSRRGIGYGAAIAFILFLILLVLSFAQLALNRRWGQR